MNIKTITSILAIPTVIVCSYSIAFGGIVTNSNYNEPVSYSIKKSNNSLSRNTSNQTTYLKTRNSNTKKNNNSIKSNNSNLFTPNNTSQTINVGYSIKQNTNIISKNKPKYNISNTKNSVKRSNTNIIINNKIDNYDNSYLIKETNVINVSQPSIDESEKKQNIGSSINITNKQKKLVDLINEERKKSGLNPLKIDKNLFEIAQYKSEDMYDESYFSHNSPNFGKTYKLLSQKNISYKAFGENIGFTYSIYKAHNGFMNSNGHRKNILNPNFTHIGIGIKGNYYTEIFIKK